ncbi:MAG: VOC family protein [Candidatus Kapaibacterium sp.]|nr:MAG: VOC family protein [Candidatus Kapabacteria bacterium]
MKRVTGIGGVFFKAENPAELKNWYEKHLDIPQSDYGTTFEWREDANPEKRGTTAWSPFKADSKYFAPSQKEWMINYRVENLVELLNVLQTEGVQIVGDMEEYDYGKFAWILDPEGNKIELWEPIETAS